MRVIPRAGTSRLGGVRDGVLLVRVASPPVEGAANAALIAVIADALQVAKRAVTIVAGERSRAKTVRVTGVNVEQATRALSAGHTT